MVSLPAGQGEESVVALGAAVDEVVEDWKTELELVVVVEDWTTELAAVVVAGVVDAPCAPVQGSACDIGYIIADLKDILLLLLLSRVKPTPSPMAMPTMMIARVVIAKESQNVTLRIPHIVSGRTTGAEGCAGPWEWLNLAACCSGGLAKPRLSRPGWTTSNPSEIPLLAGSIFELA
jgi:hypothetical protein